MKKKYIIICALKNEAKNLKKFAPIIYCGVGKINSTIKTFDAIKKYSPDLVINFGTCGSLKKNICGLKKISTFIERDMDCRKLGFDMGIVPFSKQKKLPKKNGIVLGSGDNFLTNKKNLEGLKINLDLIDMEGFSIKKTCDFLDVKFLCYKYISDNCDKNSKNSWEENINKGEKLFIEILEKKFGKSLLK